MLIWLDNFLQRCVISICELILTTKIKDYNDLKDQSLLSAFSDVYDTVWEAKTIISLTGRYFSYKSLWSFGSVNKVTFWAYPKRSLFSSCLVS